MKIPYLVHQTRQSDWTPGPEHSVERYVRQLVGTVLPCFKLLYELNLARTERSQGYVQISIPLRSLVQPKSYLFDRFTFAYTHAELVHDFLEMYEVLCIGMCVSLFAQ